MSEQPCVHPSAAELAAFPLFADDEPAALEWLAQRFEVRCFDSGEIIVQEGTPATEFIVVLEGELHFRQVSDPYSHVFVRVAGQPSGVLPFSRMKVVRGRATAVGRTRVAVMPASELHELVYRAPHLAQKLVAEMTDRTRESTQNDERSAKMLALGKLSAGLAHELNNPASAVVRSSAMLREALSKRREQAIAMRSAVVSPEAQTIMSRLSELATANASAGDKRDALERADLEFDMADWLEKQNAPATLAGDLVAGGMTVEYLEPLAKVLSREAFIQGITILVYDHRIVCLTQEIEEAARRISDLVQAVKSYSYMDQTPVSEVDVEQGIDVTLRMFQHELKHGFRVERNFSGHLPKVPGNGGELNQIWTNLIDNAIAAMSPVAGEKRLEVRTCLEPEYVLVEFADNGRGIPREIQGRIFEPFFTTKKVGEGTGLGLDIVQRIVRAHQGSIRVESKPGRTVFQVRLPLARSKANS